MCHNFYNCLVQEDAVYVVYLLMRCPTSIMMIHLSESLVMYYYQQQGNMSWTKHLSIKQLFWGCNTVCLTTQNSAHKTAGILSITTVVTAENRDINWKLHPRVQNHQMTLLPSRVLLAAWNFVDYFFMRIIQFFNSGSLLTTKTSNTLTTRRFDKKPWEIRIGIKVIMTFVRIHACIWMPQTIAFVVYVVKGIILFSWNIIHFLHGYILRARKTNTTRTRMIQKNNRNNLFTELMH